MPRFQRRSWLPAALLIACLFPAAASAQDNSNRLRLPTIAASAAAAADWASTYHALKYYNLRETNPLLQPFRESPAQLVTMGAAIDAATFSVWNVTVGRKHPRVAAAGPWAMAGFRAYLVVHNLRNERKVGRR
jgi:hypothetical protein